jgi:hypothetical protein
MLPSHWGATSKNKWKHKDLIDLVGDDSEEQGEEEEEKEEEEKRIAFQVRRYEPY